MSLGRLKGGNPVLEISLPRKKDIGRLFYVAAFATFLSYLREIEGFRKPSGGQAIVEPGRELSVAKARGSHPEIASVEGLLKYPFRLAASSGKETQVIAVDLGALLKMKLDKEFTHSGMRTKVTVCPNGMGAFGVMARIIEEAGREGNLERFNFAFICNEKGVTKEAIERMLRDFMCENGLSLKAVARIVDKNLIIDEETLRRGGGIVGIPSSPKISAEAVFSIITERLLGRTDGNGIKVSIITDSERRWEKEARRRRDITKRILWVVLNPAEEGKVLSTAAGLVVAIEGRVSEWLIEFIKKNYGEGAEKLLPQIGKDGTIFLPATPVDEEHLEKIKDERVYEIEA